MASCRPAGHVVLGSGWLHRFVSLAVPFLLGGIAYLSTIGCTDGPNRSTPISRAEPAETLQWAFSARASCVLPESEPLDASDAGFAVALSGDLAVVVGRRGDLSLALPKRASYALCSHVIGRHYPTAVLLADGTALVMSGYDATGYLESTELYDPAHGTWSAARESAAELRSLRPMGGVS